MQNVRPRAVGLYAAMLAIGTGAFFLIRSYGETLVAPVSVASHVAVAGSPATSNVLLHLLLALAAVIVTGHVLGRLLAAFGQPPVIGETLGGIALGPSLLGRFAPAVAAQVLPPAVAPSLGIVAQLGVILYMF